MSSSQQTFSSLGTESQPSDARSHSSHTRKPSASNPIVRPGPNASGPAGFQEGLSSNQEASTEGTRAPGSGNSVKDKLRKVGEKMAFLQPKNDQSLSGTRAEAAGQNASTGPE
ncbi:unnamed protein product [Sympodiomycopsis kandeliae]